MNIINNDIIERCRGGDQAAFRVVVQTFQQMVFTLAFRLMCDEEEAKDVVQETMIRVWVNFASYNSRQNLRNWIYTIAIRLCFDRLKKKAPIEPLPEDEEYFSQYVSDSDTERELENHELLSVIKTLVSRLSPKQRVIFTLVHLENLDTEEVEQITGLDAAKIKSNLYVARKTIREQLKQLGYGKDG